MASDKELRELIKEIKESNSKNPSNDLADSKDLQELSKALHERHDQVENNTKDLKDDAEKNKTFNKIQIAKEAFDFARGRDDSAKVLDSIKKQDKGLERQKKHNKGAKDAREIILEQNKIIIQQLNSLEGSLGGKGGGGNTLNKAVEENTKVIKKNQADISKADQTTIGPNKRKLDTKDKRSGYGMSDQDYANQRVRDEKATLRESGVADIHGLSDDVKTTNKSLNKKKISVDELDKGALRMKEGETLRIGGKNLQRAGEYKTTGTAKFIEKGIGVDGKPTSSFTATDPVKALAEDIRISQGVVGTTRNREQFKASKASGILAQNIGANAGELQNAIDNNLEAKTDLADLAKILKDAQAGKEGVGRKQVQEQVEKLKLSGGEDMSKMLELDSVSKMSKGGLGSNIGASLKENIFGVNQGTKLFSGAGMKQAFSADRLFGSADTGGKFSLAKLSAFQSDNEPKEAARRAKEVQSQNEAQGRMMGDEGLGLVGKEGDKKEQWREKWIPEVGQQAAQVSEATESVAAASDEPAAAKPSPSKTAAKAKVDKRTGQDTESVQEKQLETLIEIRDLLAETAGGGEEGGGGMMDMFMRRKNKGKNKGKNKKGKVKGKGMMRGKMGLATKVGGAALAVGMGVYTAVSGSKEAERMADAGELNAEEEQKAKAEAVGEGAGGAGGAIAGAAAGAAIGSVIPIVGTAIGGLIGGAIGYFGGSWAGKKAGGKIADAIDVDPGELAESNAQAEEAMKQIAEKDSDLASKIKQDAKDIEAELLEQAGDEVSDNDKEAIKNAAIVKALMNNDEAIKAIGVDRAEIGKKLGEETEKAFDSAKDSGLYDKDWLGNSEIDKSKLGDASIRELQAIVQDDDLSEEDMQAVKDQLAQKQMVAMTTNTPPTAQAVDNMNNLVADAEAGAPAPVVVSNNPPPPASGGVDDRPLIAVSSPNVRNASSTLVRRNDRTGVQI
jgi:hypothetical protein